VFQGNVCMLLAPKGQSIFLYDGVVVLDPNRIITADRSIESCYCHLPKARPSNAHTLSVIFERIIADNRIGSWRAG
jgi:hypothetical protein